MAWNRRWLRTGMVLAVALLIAVGSAVGVGVHNARADPGNGATVLHDNPQCFVEGDFTICLASTGEYSGTTTPSGIESYVYNVVQSVTVYYGATVIATDTFKVRYHGMGPNGTVQEQSDHECEVYTFLGTTYTYSYDSHIANGQIQYQSNGYQC
jgi:hypothetical protein